MLTTEYLYARYKPLVEMVRADHKDKNAEKGGHNFYHAWRVADCARKIAPNEETGKLAWIAGIIHNSDHLFPKVKLCARLVSYLETTDLSQEEREDIINSVLNHSKRNDPNDSLVQICLMDADKVVNLEADLIIRSGQFLSHLPIFDPRFVWSDDPTANYKNPKTIIRDIKGSLEWVDQDGWFRIPAAKKMAEERAHLLRLFVHTLADQLETSCMLTPEFPVGLIEE